MHYSWPRTAADAAPAHDDLIAAWTAPPLAGPRTEVSQHSQPHTASNIGAQVSHPRT
jgi:hypothetical protein